MSEVLSPKNSLSERISDSGKITGQRPNILFLRAFYVLYIVICFKHVCDFFDAEQSKNEMVQRTGAKA